MKAFLTIKFHEDHCNRPLIEAISAALEQYGVESVCIIRDVEQWGQIHFSPRQLMARTFEEIATCDLLIVDLTEKGVGLGIEAGYARAKGIPIVTIAKTGSDISETLRGISEVVYLYDDFDGLSEICSQLAGIVLDL